MSKIFISHERNDQKFVLSFRDKALKNFNVWSMADIRAGDNFEEEIIKYYYDRFDIRLELYEKDKHKQ